MKQFITFFTILLFFNLISAQTLSDTNRDSLDFFFKTLEENQKFMGQVELSRKNRTLYFYVSGFSNTEAGLKSGKETTYRIGSISKTITATLILKATEEGKISLDQTIETFFPTIKNAEKITITHLLTHHSGIHNFTSEKDFMQWNTSPKTEVEMISIISGGGSDFEPGSKAAYSNSNFVLLSYILEKIYNEEYADILQKKIISPLHLKQTQFGDKSLPESKKTHSYTYEVKWNKVIATHESIPMGAGGIIMSAHDLSLFLNGLFDGKIILKETLKKMLEQKDGYGMGIFKTTIAGHEAYTHEGRIDGFNSVYYYFPEQQLTYVLLSNGENYHLANINELALKAVFNQPFNLPKINPFKVTFQELAPYTGVYTSLESPLIITISRNGNKLLAQPEGQKIFKMDAMEKNIFNHNKSGVSLEFDPSLNLMMMTQGEKTLHFSKQ
ncbi:serine hydrolase domain-containing protein [Abyssalbus ytuae]|uniref:Beta-lactamase family protein n=1 Tax=Abyssalbus ytuae TaxID=2926907 RepID=A0A9E7CYN9_9FLAO|nr:serine hydrolase domain-containing protein [Abyssalbus ytuae]UOB16840.1 beta-lactamase family protein [Abyssalbus ytuae]